MPSPVLLTPALVVPPVPGYVGWWDASDEATVIQVAGNKVSTWKDKGSGAHNLAQATGGNQPQTRVASFNGLNMLTFDGAATFMDGTDPVSASPYTVFAVAKNVDASATQRDLFVLRKDGSGGEGRIYRTTGDHIAGYDGTTLDSSVNWGTSFPRVVALVVNGASSKVAVDGAPPTSGAAGSTAPGTGWAVGYYQFSGAEFWKGHVGEILFYASALSDANRQAVEAYLRVKWLGFGS